MAKVKQLDVSAAIEHATDSNTKVELENGYQALVAEVVLNNIVEGVLLYVPGVDYKTFKKG